MRAIGAGGDVMVYSIGYSYVHETEPRKEVVGSEDAWAMVKFQDPDSVDSGAKIPGRPPMGQGYPIVPDSAPKAVIWKSKTKLPPDYALGNNSIMLVSGRFRDLVERYEAGVHQFLPVDMYFSATDDSPFDRFYWFVCCTLIDSLDPERTTIPWRGFYDERMPDGMRRGYWKYDVTDPPQEPVFGLSAIGGRHLWRDPYWATSVVHCSDDFAEALTKSQLTGFGLKHFRQS